MEEKPRATRNYNLAHQCHHDRETRYLPNGEVACLDCMHVCERSDGSVPKYRAPFVRPHDAGPTHPDVT